MILWVFIFQFSPIQSNIFLNFATEWQGSLFRLIIFHLNQVLRSIRWAIIEFKVAHFCRFLSWVLSAVVEWWWNNWNNFDIIEGRHHWFHATSQDEYKGDYCNNNKLACNWLTLEFMPNKHEMPHELIG